MSSLPSPPTSPAAGPSSCALPLKIKLPFRTIAPLPSSPLSSTFISDDALDTDRFQSALILNNTQDDLPPLSPADSPPIIPTLYPTLPLDPATFIFDLHMLSRQNTTYPPDSGLGSSIASTEEDYTLSPKKFPETTVSASTLTGSASSRVDETIPAFGQSALSRIHEHIIRPLGEDPNLKEFQPIVHDVPLRIESKEIICLRDIEKTLLLLAPRHAKSLALYIEFCLSSIRCIQATVHYLVDHEQTRPGDRPYSSGYFIDLKEQIYEYGRQLATARAKHLPEDAGLDSLETIKLYGGIAETGRPAELVRVKDDGTAISIATGKKVDMEEAPAKGKRYLSEHTDSDESEVDAVRSMARRRKNTNLEAPTMKKCSREGCNKEFARNCDLSKHEKTHSRPFKCPISICKYHEFGWPTEKERDRHVNDKHSDSPSMYECLFKPCPYKSKRESNCKQHMEKAHGWTYVRTKSNGNRKLPGLSAAPAHHTPPLGNDTTPSTTPTYSAPTPQDQEALVNDFPLYPADSDWLETYGLQSSSLEATELEFEEPTSSYDDYPPYQNGSTFILNDEDIYAARVQLPHQFPGPEADPAAGALCKMMAQQSLSIPPIVRPEIAIALEDAGAQPRFSPSGRENAMLFTPGSLSEVEESFGDSYTVDSSRMEPTSVGLADFKSLQDLVNEMPSADMDFSQASQPGFFQSADWSSSIDYQTFPG